MPLKKLGEGPLRCLLVRPEFLEHTFYNPREVFRLLGGQSAAPPLGLLITAAHLPAHWELKLVDGDLEPVTDEHLRWADVLMISGKGPQMLPIKRLAGRAHANGVVVILGGAGPTLQPDEYVSMVDYVVCGESELVLPRLLADLAAGVSQGIYRSTETPALTHAPVPRYDLAKLDRYLFVGMSFSRGCPFSCEFCAQIQIFGRKPRTTPAARILEQHQVLYDLGHRGMIDFGYDNLIGDLKKTEEVLAAMLAWNRAHGHPFFYSTEATMNLARQPRLLELMRDNDFRYVFMGIESGDEAVLERAKKGQNTAMPAEDAVAALNRYGMVVNTGVIVGFDGEGEETAAKILSMVEKTGAFPTLVLPLHALPNTQLSRRLEREGRLFREGVIALDEQDRTDTATTGLNFVTSRPRAKVLADLAGVLERLYLPEVHEERLRRITRQLVTAHQHRPSWRKLLKLSGALVQIIRRVGLDREAAPHFWRSVARAALTNPGALEIVLGQAVMNANYRKQAGAYVEALRRQIAQVEAMGEGAYNQAMGAALAS
ncbi:MAG: B12-binding domain-containing radical SAM protein [Archangiaceae bacterium]|nr:B12-binding domain-containing radical SAM protein [Archangiaceae bacterium]